MAGEPWEIVEINLFWIRDTLREKCDIPSNAMDFICSAHNPEGFSLEFMEGAAFAAETWAGFLGALNYDTEGMGYGG